MMWCLLLFWIWLCFYLSLQKLSGTTKLSSTITKTLLQLFHLSGQTYYMPLFDGFRLAAHVLVFTVLSMLIYGALFLTKKNRKKIFALSFAIGILASVASEWAKLFVPGRHCSISDMILNFLGCILGLGLIYIVKKER